MADEVEQEGIEMDDRRHNRQPREAHLEAGLVVRSVPLDRCSLCFKYVLIMVNAIFLLCGVAMFLLALYIAASGDKRLVAGGTFVVVLVALGIGIMLLASFGLSGARKDSNPTLCLYVVLLCAIGAGILGGGIYLLVAHDGNIIINAWMVSPNDVRVEIENRWGCCGLRNSGEYVGSPCPVDSTNTPCFPLLSAWFAPLTRGLAAFALALAVTMVLVLICTVQLMRGISKASLHAFTNV